MESVNYEFMTDAGWERMEALLPDSGNFGRPCCSVGDVPEGILWGVKTGERWRDIPKHLPSPATCWRRLGDWEEDEVWDNLKRAFISQLDEQGLLDWQERFMDDSFAPVRKRGPALEKPQGAKKQSGWWWRGGALSTAVDTMADCRERTGRFPKRLITDRANDANRLRKLLRHLDGELICPDRRGSKRKSLQDGRALRRFRKRWKIELPHLARILATAARPQ